MFDLTGEPTLACICGCLMFEITVMWDEEDRAVGWYDLTQKCKDCGSISTISIFDKVPVTSSIYFIFTSAS